MIIAPSDRSSPLHLRHYGLLQCGVGEKAWPPERWIRSAPAMVTTRSGSFASCPGRRGVEALCRLTAEFDSVAEPLLTLERRRSRDLCVTRPAIEGQPLEVQELFA